MLNNLKPWQRHLVVAGIGTTVLWVALKFLPLPAVLAIAFVILYIVDNNNDIAK